MNKWTAQKYRMMEMTEQCWFSKVLLHLSLWLGLHFLSLKSQVPTDKGKSAENAFSLSEKKVKVSRLSLLTSVCYLDGRIAIVDALEGKAHL